MSDEADMDDDTTDDMSEMQRLLDEQESSSNPLSGAMSSKGKIVHMDHDEILVDIGLKSEGVLTTKELPASGLRLACRTQCR